MKFLPALMLLFIGLKLTGVIAWSWFWVLSPTAIPLSIAILIFCGGLVVALDVRGWVNSKLKSDKKRLLALKSKFWSTK